MDIATILPYVQWYAVVAFGVLIINSVIAGFLGNAVQKDDVVQSIFWPVSTAQLLGLTVRVIFENIKGK